ncbi:MAG: putative oxidoreductase C-terminal domain-containing protein, partial [Balneolales bacterium]
SFKVRGVHGRVLAGWGYENPNGGDTHYSVMRGTLANLIIKQDEEQEFTATLYVEPTDNSNKEKFESILDKALVSLSDKYPGLYAESSDYGLEIKIPDEFQEGHEDHFTRVTEQYLDYLKNEKIQEWELTNLLTKYYITTRAYELSR